MIKFKKTPAEDVFDVGTGKRFVATAERHPGGGIKGWRLVDNGRKLGNGIGSWFGYFQNRNAVREYVEKVLSQELTPAQKAIIEKEVKNLLHCHRDCLRNRGVDTTKVSIDPRDGYYGEAFGMMRTVVALGFGEFGAINVDKPRNVSFWLNKLEKEVLDEEGFGGDNECEVCFNKYGKDSVRKGGR